MELIESIWYKFELAEKTNIAVAFAGFFVSVIVLVVTIKSWLLKRGQAVRASYGISVTDKPYVSSVIIENLKDRDLVIFAMYLKFGPNVYLDLLDIDDNYDRYHHIIPALSTRIFELGEPLYYTEGSREVDMERLLYNLGKGTIVLLTNQGKIKAKKIKRGWSPIAQYFKNYGTCYVRPRRLYTKDAVPSSRQQRENYIDYSSFHKGVHYIVTLRFKDGNEFGFDIPPFNNYVAFSQLKFTQDALASCDTLQQFFLENRAAGIVNFEEIVSIIDVKQIIDCDRKKIYSDKIESIEAISGFNYHIVCKLKTWLYKIKNPGFPSKLFSFYCWIGIKDHPNKRNKTHANIQVLDSLPPKKDKKKSKRRKGRDKRN